MRVIVTFVLLLLVALVLGATAPATQAPVKRDASVAGQENVEGKESDEKICIKYKHLKCTYVNKCVKAEEYCKEEVVKSNECAKWGFEMVKEKRKVCVKLAVDTKNPEKCTTCAEVGEEEVTIKKDKCLEYKAIKECVAYGSKCSEHKLLKRCYTEVHPLELEGPKSCPTGQVLKFTRVDNTVTRTCVDAPKVAPKDLFCRGYADPHMVNDAAKSFEFQQAGDFVFIRSSEGVFQCHVRFKSFGSWTGAVAFACRINGRDLLEYELGGKATLNGHTTSFQNGIKATLPEGGYVLKTGSKVEVVSPNGCKFNFIEYKTYANIEAYHPEDIKVEGLCKGAVKESAKGLFSYKYRSEFLPEAVVPLTFLSDEERNNAITLCKNRGLDEGSRLERCLFDYANTPAGERRQVLDVEKQEAKETDKQRADLAVSAKK